MERAVRHVCPAPLADRRDDLVQAAMVRILKLAQRGEGIEELGSSYLYKVAHSALVDEIRRLRRRREVSLEDEQTGNEAAAAGAELETHAPAERALASAEIGRGIDDCLARMVADRKQAVTLWLLGHGVPESSRLLGWPRKRVENLVYRGLADLRSCLEAKGITP